MKRCNFPHRKNIRRKSALERMKTNKGMKGRNHQHRRDALREVIRNTTKNLENSK